MYQIEGTRKALDGFGLDLDTAMAALRGYREDQGLSRAVALTDGQLDEATLKVAKDGSIWPLKQATDAMKLRMSVDFVDHWMREQA